MKHFYFLLSRYHISPKGMYGFPQPVFKKVINVQLQYTQTSHNQFHANRTIIGNEAYIFFHSCIMTFPAPISRKYILHKGTRGSAVGRGTALQAERSRVRFLMVSLEFFIDIILPAAL